jgi:hypothetical protein
VKSSRERDDAIDRSLRQAIEAPPMADTTPSCLDAETLAAMIDGGLADAALAAAHAHVADCARCQQLVAALAKIESPVHSIPAASPSRRWLMWAAPLAAAAAVAGVWVAIPNRAGSPEPAVAAPRVAEKSIDQPALPSARSAPLRRDTGPAAAAAAGKDQRPAEQRSEKKAETDRRPNLPAAPSTNRFAPADALSAPVAAPPPAEPQEAHPPVQPPAATQAGKAAPAPFNSVDALRMRGGRADVPQVEIASPEPAIRWRISAATVQRSTDGGATWEIQPTENAEVLTNGTSPAPTICWLVGRRGVVLLTIDGRTWRRVEFPEITDLSAIQATDGGNASVSTADGRTFTTNDAGATWVRRPPQDF